MKLHRGGRKKTLSRFLIAMWHVPDRVFLEFVYTTPAVSMGSDFFPQSFF
jgi:hypothetical protein